MRTTIGTGLALLILLAAPAWAGNWSFNDPHDAELRYEEDAPWQEQQLEELPPFPDPEKLLEVPFQHPGARFRFYLDPASLSVGKDGVVRYTLVLESVRTGNRNIMYEGMRCATRGYKTIAYGTRKNKFRPLARPRWLSIDNGRSNWYRRDLWEYFLCKSQDEAGRPTVSRILDSIRYARASEQSFSQ